jgi:uncharacterized membrane protein
MQSIVEYLKVWQPHPFVDHFTVALILLGIVTDLVASLFSSRLWMRYMALTLMIVGAIAAAGSYVTGGWEAGRVWDSVSGHAKDVLRTHAWWGNVLPWVFGGLALWRLGVQFLGFVAVSRPIYLLGAIIGGVLIVYQAHLGGVMVYEYGVGTALLTGGQTNAPPPATPFPQVTGTPNIPAPSSVLPSPPPSSVPTIAPSPVTSTPTPAPSISATPLASPTPASSPTGGMAATPSPSASSTPGGGAAKNL